MFEAAQPLTVVTLVRTSEGYALLLNTEVTSSRADALVVLLNRFGQLAGPAHKFEGASMGYGIAAQKEGLAILARKRGADAFRPLDAMGGAIGPWVCLDAEIPNRDQSGSLAADGLGYAAIYRDPDGATYFVHLGAEGGP